MGIKATIPGWYQVSSHPKHVFYFEANVSYEFGKDGMLWSEKGPAKVKEFKEPIKETLKRDKNRAKRMRRKYK